MYKLICPNCNKENTFQSLLTPPTECSFCFEPIDSSIEITENKNEELKKEILGLTISYQKNNQQLEIPCTGKTVLGRENFGADLFSNIKFNGNPVISRIHCSIEFRDNCFYILDEGSKNGTFYGMNKINCNKSPQVIEDKSVFYIGQEPFLAQINYKENNNEINIDQVELQLEVSTKIKHYRCRVCGHNFEEFKDECPNCDRFNTLTPIYE